MLQSALMMAAKLKILGKSPVNAYLRLNRRIWNKLPPSIIAHRPVQLYGNFLLTLVRHKADRTANFGTYFMRNRPQLEVIRRLSKRMGKNSILRIAVMACSLGAEVYSILWTIRKARPDLKIRMTGVDISKEILDFAQKGMYSLTTPDFINVPFFERLTEEEMRNIFDIEGDNARIKSWIKEGINWQLGNAEDPELLEALGPQDMVVANNFLCHMDPPNAEICLCNISRFVKPDGYLFVSGVDLEVRTKIALDLGWKPVPELMEEIHDGDPSLRHDWPLKWWGLEPFNKRRPDWNVRYASVFQIVSERKQ